MSPVVCRGCGRPTVRLRLKVGQWNIVQCRSCGLAFLDPFPTLESLKRLYNSDYFEEHIDYYCSAEQIEEHVQRVRPLVEKIMRFRPTPGCLLDVGCGMGFFLAAARQAGWRVWGVEISAWACDFARQTLGLETVICSDTLGQAELPSQMFDVVTMWHVLEHVPEPGEFIAEASRLLQPEGLLVVETPNFASLEAWRHRERWRGLDVPYHLYHFTPRTMRVLLEQHSFRILAIEFEMLYRASVWLRKIRQSPNSRLGQFLRRYLTGRDMTFYAMLASHFLEEINAA